MGTTRQKVKSKTVEGSCEFADGSLDIQLRGYRPLSLNRQQRMHYRNRKRDLERTSLMLRAATAGKVIPMFAAPVRVTYWQFYARLPMDWDNFGASMKHILDGLVRIGILQNDSPREVAQVILGQTKVKTEGEEGLRVMLEPALPAGWAERAGVQAG